MEPVETWADVFAIYLENARWLVEEARGRTDGLHQRASYILGFSGVVLAILPTFFNTVLSTRGWFIRDVCWILLVVVVILLSCGAVFAARVMFVHEVLEVPATELQSRWVEWTNKTDKEPFAAQALADYANALFGREANDQASPLLAIMADGDRRAHRLRASMWITVSGIATLALMLIALIIARI
ncbi:MAG: hypothetical protein ACHQFZ_02190 [Acidimicrobiales bacterium]